MAQPDRQGAARPNPRRQHRPRRRREAIDAKVKAKLLRLFRDGVLVGLKDIPRDYNNTKQPEYRLLLEVLRDREADVLRFVNDLRIPPTNNQAERDLRPAKTQQKISGRLQSETVT